MTFQSIFLTTKIDYIKFVSTRALVKFLMEATIRLSRCSEDDETIVSENTLHIQAYQLTLVSV